MQSFAFTHYHPPLARNEVDIDYVEVRLPVIPIRILGYEANISGFRRMHVDTWLSTASTISHGVVNDKDIFGSIKTGDSGVGNGRMMGLDIETDKIFLNFWSHNMTLFSKDWHTSYVLYYEAV